MTIASGGYEDDEMPTKNDPRPDAVPHKSSDSEVKRIRFRCMNQKCGAEDVGKFYPSEPIPVIVNCWQCHAGLNMSPDQMMAARQGMLQVTESGGVGAGNTTGH